MEYILSHKRRTFDLLKTNNKFWARPARKPRGIVPRPRNNDVVFEMRTQNAWRGSLPVDGSWTPVTVPASLYRDLVVLLNLLDILPFYFYRRTYVGSVFFGSETIRYPSSQTRTTVFKMASSMQYLTGDKAAILEFIDQFDVSYTVLICPEFLGENEPTNVRFMSF